MNVQELIDVLKKMPLDFKIYIPMYYENRRALYKEPFEGAIFLDKEDIELEKDEKAVCLGCSIRTTNIILDQRKRLKLAR